MSDFTKELEFMSPEDLTKWIEEKEKEYDFAPDKTYSTEDIRNMLDLQVAFAYEGDIESSGRSFEALELIVNKFHQESSSEDLDDALDYLADWNLLAIKHAEESSKEFLCTPLYRTVFDAFDKAPPKFRIKEVNAKLQFVHHIRYWIAAHDGEFDRIDEKEQEFFRHMHDHYPEELIKVVDEQEKLEEWDNVTDLQRSMYRFARYSRLPNDAVKWGKALLDSLPNRSDYFEADSGDQAMELGKLFFEFKKYSASNRYFQQALDIYSALGEDFEMFSMQAESWLEQCEEMA